MKRALFQTSIFLSLIYSCSALGEPKKAIVIGASSGMGREVARLLSKEGYTVGLAARRTALLESLQQELSPAQSHVKQLDVTDPHARESLKEFIKEMGGLDLIVISISPYLDIRNAKQYTWKEKELTLDVVEKGFIAMADIAFEQFEQQNSGHLVGISSTSGLFGTASCPEYCAAKAAVSTYMEGKRNQMVRDGHNIKVTDVIPGFVAVEHSPLGQDPEAYWEITTKEAGKTILEGIKKEKDVVYVPRKVWLLNLIKALPKWAYYRYFNWM